MMPKQEGTDGNNGSGDLHMFLVPSKIAPPFQTILFMCFNNMQYQSALKNNPEYFRRAILNRSALNPTQWS